MSTEGQKRLDMIDKCGRPSEKSQRDRPSSSQSDFAPLCCCGAAPDSRLRSLCPGCALHSLGRALRQLRIDFRPESYKWSLIQAMLSRGDRRLTPLLLAARGFGDSLGSYKRAFKEMAGTLPPFEFFVHRDAPAGEEVLPWTHLRGPLPEKTLVAHAMEARGHMGEVPTGKFLLPPSAVVVGAADPAAVAR